MVDGVKKKNCGVIRLQKVILLTHIAGNNRSRREYVSIKLVRRLYFFKLPEDSEGPFPHYSWLVAGLALLALARIQPPSESERSGPPVGDCHHQTPCEPLHELLQQ